MTAPKPMRLVDVAALRVSYGSCDALIDLDLRIDAGERVALVGASGSGKSTCIRALVGLADGATVRASCLRVAGVDVITAPPGVLQQLRGRSVGLAFQDPLATLDPLQRVGSAMTEVLRVHHRLDRRGARRRAVALFDEVALGDAEAMLRRYPHQLSGGQRQRVGLALALAGEPALLLADEPTSALDPALAIELAGLLRQLCRQRGLALLLVSHDLLLVRALCERLVVLDGGTVVEAGTVEDVIARPKAAATRALIEAAGLAFAALGEAAGLASAALVENQP